MSMNITKPIIRKIKDNETALAEFEKDIKSNEAEDAKDIIMNFPTVYIHNWPETNKYDVYKLKPNKMQEEFICSVHDLIERGAKKALLISATGTGKTYASAFAMRNEKPKKALFIVHRELIARQALKSYKKVFGSTKKLALLSGNSKEYDADILFATMSMMAKTEHCRCLSIMIKQKTQ